MFAGSADGEDLQGVCIPREAHGISGDEHDLLADGEVALGDQVVDQLIG